MNWLPVPNHENAMEINENGQIRITCYGFVKIPFLPGEEWRIIKSLDCMYSASNYGRIREECNKMSKQRILLQYPSGRDRVHLSVSIKRNGKRESRLVHHLVAQAWLPPKPDNKIILHGALGRQNNFPSNLSYGTHVQNAGPDRERDGTLIKGEQSCWAKLTEKDVVEIRKSSENCRVLAEKYGVSPGTISKAKTGKTWKHVR